MSWFWFWVVFFSLRSWPFVVISSASHSPAIGHCFSSEISLNIFGWNLIWTRSFQILFASLTILNFRPKLDRLKHGKAGCHMHKYFLGTSRLTMFINVQCAMCICSLTWTYIHPLLLNLTLFIFHWKPGTLIRSWTLWSCSVKGFFMPQQLLHQFCLERSVMCHSLALLAECRLIPAYRLQSTDFPWRSIHKSDEWRCCPVFLHCVVSLGHIDQTASARDLRKLFEQSLDNCRYLSNLKTRQNHGLIAPSARSLRAQSQVNLSLPFHKQACF